MLAITPAAAHAQTGNSEITALRTFEATESYRAPFTPATAVKFNESDHFFVRSALAIDFTYRSANVTLPLYRGASPSGQPVYYIITDASDFTFAHELGSTMRPSWRRPLNPKARRRSRSRTG